MPDNTTLNLGTGGDTIRDVLKGSVKTPVCVIDAGGGGAESLLTAGQATKANSLPVTLASDTGALPVSLQTSQLYSGAASTTPLFAPISAASSGDANVLVAGTTGKKILVLKWCLNVAGAVNLKFRDFDGTSTYADLTGLFALVANQPLSGAFCPVGHFQTATGHGLTLNLSSAVQVSGYLVYVLV